MSVASYPILKLSLELFYLSVFFFLFNVFLYIHEYANEIICIFIIRSTSYISTFFGTMSGSPGYMAAEM